MRVRFGLVGGTSAGSGGPAGERIAAIDWFDGGILAVLEVF